MRKSKMVSCVLVITMCLGVFAGCKKTQQERKTESIAVTEVTTESTTKKPATEITTQITTDVTSVLVSTTAKKNTSVKNVSSTTSTGTTTQVTSEVTTEKETMLEETTKERVRKISDEQFNQIVNSMTYEEVVAVLGGEPDRIVDLTMTDSMGKKYPKYIRGFWNTGEDSYVDNAGTRWYPCVRIGFDEVEGKMLVESIRFMK